MAEDGLQQILVTERQRFLRLLCARGATREEAEDVLQEAIVKLATINTGPVTDAHAYLYRLVSNQFLDWRRANSRRAQRELAWAGPTDGDLLAASPSAEAVLMNRERLDRVLSALGALPDKTATIFRRFRIDGIAQQVIATEQDISLSAVEKHLQRAYRAIIEVDRQGDAEMPAPRRLNDRGGWDER